MESNYELKENDTKNCICYYSNDMIKIEDFDFENILIDEKANENVCVIFNNISYLKELKSSFTYVFLIFLKKIKVD